MSMRSQVYEWDSADYGTGVAARTESIFAVNARIDVVGDNRRATEFIFEQVFDPDICPTEVRRVKNESLV